MKELGTPAGMKLRREEGREEVCAVVRVARRKVREDEGWPRALGSNSRDGSLPFPPPFPLAPSVPLHNGSRSKWPRPPS